MNKLGDILQPCCTTAISKGNSAVSSSVLSGRSGRSGSPGGCFPTVVPGRKGAASPVVRWYVRWDVVCFPVPIVHRLSPAESPSIYVLVDVSGSISPSRHCNEIIHNIDIDMLYIWILNMIDMENGNL